MSLYKCIQTFYTHPQVHEVVYAHPGHILQGHWEENSAPSPRTQSISKYKNTSQFHKGKKVVILMKVLLDYAKIPASWRRLPVKPVNVQCIEQVSRIHLWKSKSLEEQDHRTLWKGGWALMW